MKKFTNNHHTNHHTNSILLNLGMTLDSLGPPALGQIHLVPRNLLFRSCFVILVRRSIGIIGIFAVQIAEIIILFVLIVFVFLFFVRSSWGWAEVAREGAAIDAIFVVQEGQDFECGVGGAVGGWIASFVLCSDDWQIYRC